MAGGKKARAQKARAKSAVSSNSAGAASSAQAEEPGSTARSSAGDIRRYCIVLDRTDTTRTLPSAGIHHHNAWNETIRQTTIPDEERDRKYWDTLEAIVGTEDSGGYRSLAWHLPYPNYNELPNLHTIESDAREWAQSINIPTQGGASWKWGHLSIDKVRIAQHGPSAGGGKILVNVSIGPSTQPSADSASQARPTPLILIPREEWDQWTPEYQAEVQRSAQQALSALRSGTSDAAIEYMYE